MTQFFAALAVFVAAHVVPSLPGVRPRLVKALGHRVYIAAYSTVSIVLLGLLVYATLRLDYLPLWTPSPWQAWVTIVLTPIGLFLLIAGLISRNPLSVSMRGRTGTPGAIVGITRHPVLWGFMLWAGSHLVPNGDLRAVLLFGALFVFAAIGIPLSERRARKRLGAAWDERARVTSIVPFAAMASGRARPAIDKAMLAALLVTLALTAYLLAGGHALLLGADPLSLALA